ncbi:hypothetical protein QTP81_01355 [Alteromonas sp. ASW11-36]|uniref:Uncharacterized protein n=1 Tax=Alteromonas arenosi TaxID=3055817 RepID=A0ABT7SSX4_9ALTE|nr:hypothetical protein [Alteromonas sp. ASW11-36]MDM7859250.1 hypothetical protein [Alteromonas sp. ASW11-36]
MKQCTSWALSFLLPFIVFSTALASPTENEFESCKKLAVKILEACLEYNEEECWVKSKADYESCRLSVLEMHSSEQRKQRGKAEAEEMERRRKETKEDGQ